MWEPVKEGSDVEFGLDNGSVNQGKARLARVTTLNQAKGEEEEGRAVKTEGEEEEEVCTEKMSQILCATTAWRWNQTRVSGEHPKG